MAKNKRYTIPGRGGSLPVGDKPKERASVTIDPDLLEAVRERVGKRGLSAQVERLLRVEENRCRLEEGRPLLRASPAPALSRA